MKRVLLLVVAVCFTVFSFAQDQNAGEIVEKANAAVESKDFAKAVELYESALAIPDHGQDEANINKVISQLKPIVAKDNAKAALDEKDFDKALELYKAAIADFPDDASIAEQAGVRFYNAGITSYKEDDFLSAVKCFTVSEIEFNYDKAGKYRAAAMKKVAEGLAAEGITEVEDVAVREENEELLLESLAKVYVSEGNELYKKGAAILSAANEQVNAGRMTTEDDAYKAEVEKAKVELKAAVEVLEKAKAADATNENAQKLLDACNAVLN